MIARLKGNLAFKAADHLIVDVGGVGYHVLISLTSHGQLPECGNEVSLHIHTHVREDQLALFGFVSLEERSIFQRLINVSGIGPKLALSLLSGMAPHDIVDAVIKEDLARLNAISGIGKKTAERIIVELRDKFMKDFAGMQKTSTAPKPLLYDDVLSALTNLGYPRSTAEKAIAQVNFAKDSTVQGAVKQILKVLGQGAPR